MVIVVVITRDESIEQGCVENCRRHTSADTGGGGSWREPAEAKRSCTLICCLAPACRCSCCSSSMAPLYELCLGSSSSYGGASTSTCACQRCISPHVQDGSLIAKLRRVMPVGARGKQDNGRVCAHTSRASSAPAKSPKNPSRASAASIPSCSHNRVRRMQNMGTNT